jgi:PAS domain-containing protein
MAQREIEVILMRQLADCLAMPIFVVDGNGTLVFYNEPAEKILGRRFDETGELPAGEWSSAFTPTDEQGTPLQPEQLPLMIALSQRRPAHSSFWIRGWDNVRRRIQVTAFPLIGRAGRFLGAVALFWEV